MKYLSDYMQDAQTELFLENGVFFAFSEKQFTEKQEKGVIYSSLSSGMICPKNNVKYVMDELDNIYQNAISKDIEENGKEAIIKRELANHETQLTGDWQQIESHLEDYNITKEEVENGYIVYYQYCIDNDLF